MKQGKIQSISFFSETSDFIVPEENNLSLWLKHIMNKVYNISEYAINFIFVSSEKITKLNELYLQHNYPTDVIAFDFSSDFNVFGGDIYICPEIVFENAKSYHISSNDELRRVMVHGLLHFIGYNDKTDKETAEMREQENHCLKIYQTVYSS